MVRGRRTPAPAPAFPAPDGHREAALRGTNSVRESRGGFKDLWGLAGRDQAADQSVGGSDLRLSFEGDPEPEIGSGSEAASTQGSTAVRVISHHGQAGCAPWALNASGLAASKARPKRRTMAPP